MAMHNSAPSARYGGWQHERSGFIGNLSGPGFALLAAAVVALMIPLQWHSLVAASICIPLGGVLLLLAFGRVYGLSAETWLMLAVRHHMAVARTRNTFLSGLFAPAKSSGEQPLDLPGGLARLRILDASDGLGGRLGIAHDPVAGTYTAVLRVHHPGLALADAARQDSRVGAWGDFLRGACKEAGAISRIAVHQRCLPDDGTALRAWTRDHITTDAPPAAVHTLDTLMDTAGPAATVRETYLSLTLSSARARLAIRSAGGGQAGAAAVLVQELHSLQGALSGASLTVEKMLTPREVAETIRTAYDPGVQPLLAKQRTDGGESGVPPELAGPAATQADWSVYWHDGSGANPCGTVSYQVRGLPHSEVYATFLQPLLRPRANARRMMTLIYEPLPPDRARRELGSERTKRNTARVLRRRSGKADSEDHRREAETAKRQDEARAAGHGVVRLTALVGVTVTDPEQLPTACVELEADASDSGLQLRRCWGAQSAAFASAALPLGVGLPNRRVGI